MGLVFRFLRWFWRRIADLGTAGDVLDFFDIKTAALAACAGVLAMIGLGAINLDWSPAFVVLVALAGGILAAALALLVRTLIWGGHRAEKSSESGIVAQANTGETKIGDYTAVCSLTIRNTSASDFTRLLAQMEQFSGAIPNGMAFPLVLRTEGQIRGERSGRFTLSPGQPKTLPIIFVDPIRANEWCFFDEAGHKFSVPGGTTKLVIGIYGGTEPTHVLVEIETDVGWRPNSTIQVVPRDFQFALGMGGKGGSGEIFGDHGIIIGGKGGRVGAGGLGRGGDGGGGTIHGGGGIIIGGEGGSVDGTHIWFPPAQSAIIQHIEATGRTPDFGVQYPGAGGASAGWLQRQQVVLKIREEYFRQTGQRGKIKSSKIEDVPLDYINEKLEEAGYPWRARIEKKYWYLYYEPTQ